MDDGAGDGVEPDTRHGFGGRNAGLLEEAHVERHPSDVGRRHAVHERRRHLRFDVGDERYVLGHRTRHADRARDICQERHEETDDQPRPAGMPNRAEAVTDIRQLRKQDVERADERGDHEHRAGPNADQAFERRRLLTAHRRDRGAKILQHGLRHFLTRRGRKRKWLQVGDCLREQGRSDHASRRRDCPIGADEHGERRQQLGDRSPASAPSPTLRRSRGR